MSLEKFIGTWRLLSCEGRNASDDGDDSQVLRIYGDAPFGQLMYDDHGNMMVVLMHPERTSVARGDRSQAAMDEIRAAFNEFNSYCGTYTVDPEQGTVTHHVRASLIPQWVGVDQLRHFEFAEDRLTLRTPPLPIRGQMWTMALVWERM